MSIYSNNFNKIREENRSVFDALERALHQLDVDFYLIGAQSRDVWIEHLNLKGKRTTTDIDYLVYVKDRETWDALVKYLDEEGFQRDEELPYRFGNIDLIPIGGIVQNGEVLLEDPAISLSVVGCKEVTEQASVQEGNFKIITLPGLCILKLIAFDEKPDQRAKDYDDYLYLVQRYYEIGGAEVFSVEHEDLITDDFDYTIASARLLGRQMQQVLSVNEGLRNKVMEILKSRLRGFSFEEIDQMYAVDKKDEKVEEFKLVAETLKGILDAM